MMYVRTDILEKLGLAPPETWDDLPGIITTLSQQNMEMGIPQALLGSLLVQNGLSYYQPGFEKTVFSTQEAYDVYAQYLSLIHIFMIGNSDRGCSGPLLQRSVQNFHIYPPGKKRGSGYNGLLFDIIA